MNIAIRKLAMLEKAMLAQEEASRIDGYSTCPINQDLKQQITTIMDKVRAI